MAMAATLVSSKILVQYCNAPYTNPQDIVKAVHALQVWRDRTLAENSN
jgi:hypothetical protein